MNLEERVNYDVFVSWEMIEERCGGIYERVVGLLYLFYGIYGRFQYPSYRWHIW